MLKQLLSGQTAIQKEQALLTKQQQTTERSIAAINSRLSEIDGTLQDLRTGCDQTKTIQATVQSVQKTPLAHERNLIDLDDRSRRSNLVVFGIPESPNETDTTLRSKVISEVFEKTLGVSCVSVARIHRLGRRTNMRPIVHFQDFNEKQAVLRNSKKLKGSKIFIQNDYSNSTLTKRKLLWESTRGDKASGKNVFLVNDKLRIDNDIFVWDDIKKESVVLPSNGASASVRD